MFGYGRLRSLKGRQNLADATLSLREEFQQLQTGGV
jgi:hypothetical protein